MYNMEFGTPIGLKINLVDVTETNTIDRIVDKLKSYHKGVYIVGKDSKYCDQPHYHIHFWSDKKVTKDALKQFRSKNLKDMMSRSAKLYTGADDNSQPMAWYGYAIKEELIEAKGLDDNMSQIKIDAGSSLKVKQMANVKSAMLKQNELKKKELKDKLFEYIKANTPIDNCGNFIESHESICQLIIKYFKQEDMYGHLTKTIIERYYKEYCGKHLGKNEEFFYKFIFR